MHVPADDREVTMSDQTPPRFRVRISTLLSLVAIAALLVVVIMQQVRIERMKRTMAAEIQQRTQQLAKIIREQRDYIERHKVAPSAPQPGR
jgi:sensor histidine kinase regulating citrate/malate metabolism